MRNITILLLLTFLTFQTHANVSYIDITKITNDRKLVAAYNFVKDNKQYYDRWTNEWSYDKSKQDLKSQLRIHYENFSELMLEHEERYLLLGDIAHYLYNMDDTVYYSVAVQNYNKAAKTNPNDYRAYWFLGYHYGVSNNPNLAIDNFVKAEKLLPQKQSSDFWNDYAWVTAVANMPSHCIYAMDKVKSISGKKGSFQQHFGETIYNRIIPVDKTRPYNKEDIWTVMQDDKIIFTSRPLGIKLLVDSTWGIQVYDYQKNQGVFIMRPTTIANKQGKEVNYTIAILMKTVSDKAKLENYIKDFVSSFSDKRKIEFSSKYDKMVAYEMKDKTKYQDIGGGRFYMIGIERKMPQYPGLLLEAPVAISQEGSGELTYYTASKTKDRFKGKIFYALILDSSEDINDQSYTIFKSFFENQLIIE
jgi:tetratricopeptide (TPR) repeat protein